MQKGFTLVEALISMIITAISFSFFIVLVIQLSPMRITAQHNVRAEFYIKHYRQDSELPLGVIKMEIFKESHSIRNYYLGEPNEASLFYSENTDINQ